MYLRPYQQQAIESIYSYFQTKHGNPVIAMPTGTGKSLVQAGFLQRALADCNSQRFISLTHVKELVQQNAKQLQNLWPMAPVGIHSEGLNQRETNAPIIFGGIQSAIKDPAAFGYRDLMFVDEAQLLSPNDNSMYQQFIDVMLQLNPRFKVVGLTATPFRMGQGMLTDYPLNGGTRIFTDICFDITGVEAFTKLIDDCYLAPLVTKHMNCEIDVSDIKVQAGDFVQAQVAEAIRKQHIIDSALAETMEVAKNRHCWLVFAAGIKNTLEITEKLIARGINTTCIHSNAKGYPKITSEERDKRIESFKAGRFRALVVNNIGTVGFDHPLIDCIVDLRPTTSVVFHIQKYGRGTRPAFHPSFDWDQLRHLEYRKQAIEMSQKHNCMVLDYAGNIGRLGPINDPQIPKGRKKGNGDVPVKICPMCGTYNYTPARFCCDEDCNYEFIFKTKLERQASTEEVIRRIEDPQIDTWPVTLRTYNIHKKAGKPDSLRVNYFSGHMMFPVWLGFEHKGLMRKRAVDWWRQHSPDDPPKTAQEALERFDECRQTNRIKVLSNGKYPEILEFQF